MKVENMLSYYNINPILFTIGEPVGWEMKEKMWMRMDISRLSGKKKHLFLLKPKIYDSSM